MPKLARCLHNLYLFMCESRGGGGGERGGGQGVRIPPGKLQKYRVSFNFFSLGLAYVISVYTIRL